MAGFLKHLVQRMTAASPLLTPRFSAPYERVQRDVQPDVQPDLAGGDSQPSQDPTWTVPRRSAARREVEAFAQSAPPAVPDRHAEPQAWPASQPPAAMPLRTAVLVEEAALREQTPLPVDETAHAHVGTAVPVPPRKARKKTAQLSRPAQQPIDTAMPETALLVDPPQQPGFAVQPDLHRQYQGRDAPSRDKTTEPEAKAGEGQAATPSVARQPGTVEAHSATLPLPKQPPQQPSPKGVLLEPALPRPMPAQPMPVGDASAQVLQHPAEASTVHVTIGRVELRAAAPAPAQPGARHAGARPALSLGDYLARRSNGARR
jgi:hypothetical protein